MRRLFQLLAPSLHELCIAHCSDIFHAASFADVALLQVHAMSFFFVWWWWWWGGVG